MSGSADRPAWHKDWDALTATIGQDLFHLPEHRKWGSARGDVIWGADPIEAGALRRYLEPLEFSNAIHCDRDAAQAQGYRDLVVPATALLTFAAPPMWHPGGSSVFVSDGRNDQPVADDEGSFASFPAAKPPYTSYFGTDFALTIIRPAVVGDWIGKHGSRLLSVVPKATAVGRGAFIQWEIEFVAKPMEPIAVYRPQMFVYEPFAEGERPK